MARILIFLTDKLVLSTNEGLKKLGKLGSIERKLQAIIAAKKYGRIAKFYTITKKF